MSIVKETVDNTVAIQNYEFTKHTLNVIIDNQIEIIILVGAGSNGKTHLINECTGKLKDNNYKILHECPLGPESSKGFETILKCYNQNIIMTSTINPFTHYDMVKTNNIVIIDMNHIIF